MRPVTIQRMEEQRARPRFLVADDMPAMAALVGALLREAGAEVVATAHDGAEALRRFDDIAPDAVVLDIEMPELNGFQVLQAIRAREGPTRCLAIILTAHSEHAMREEAFASGADHFLHKGTDLERLLEIVPDFAGRLAE
jgi:chemosensory pili system protein ChpA (sensor histidine kinase/response regulator)